MSMGELLSRDLKAATTPGSKEKHLQLYNEMLAGDPTARQRLIESGCSMIFAIVKKRIRETLGFLEYRRDDLLAEAALGITLAVDNMQRKGPVKNANPDAMMSMYAASRVFRFLDEGVTCGKLTRERHRKAGLDDVPQCTALGNVALLDGEVKTRSSFLQDLRRDSERHACGATMPAATDLLDAIENACGDDIDRMIVRLKADGLNDGDVAAVVSRDVKPIDRSAISHRVRQIYKRLQSCE